MPSNDAKVFRENEILQQTNNEMLSKIKAKKIENE